MKQLRVEKVPLRGTGIHGWAVKRQRPKPGHCWPSSSSSSTTAAGACVAVKSFAESWEGQSWENTTTQNGEVKAEKKGVLVLRGVRQEQPGCAISPALTQPGGTSKAWP